jgi:hypothetical protein
LVATILTLIFLPTLYVAWFKGVEESSALAVDLAPTSQHMR